MSNVIEKIFDPIEDLVNDIGDGLEDVIESDVFKTVAIGAAVYFGGAGLIGLSNGTGFMAGMSSAGSTWSSALGFSEAVAGTTEVAAVAGDTAAAAEVAAGGGNAVNTISAVGNTTQGMTAGDAMMGAAKLQAATQGVGIAVNAYGEHMAEEEREEERDKQQFFGMNRNGEGGQVYKPLAYRPGTRKPGQVQSAVNQTRRLDDNL